MTYAGSEGRYRVLHIEGTWCFILLCWLFLLFLNIKSLLNICLAKGLTKINNSAMLLVTNIFLSIFPSVLYAFKYHLYIFHKCKRQTSLLLVAFYPICPTHSAVSVLCSAKVPIHRSSVLAFHPTKQNHSGEADRNSKMWHSMEAPWLFRTFSTRYNWAD